MIVDLYIGPLIARNGGYSYDTFSGTDGLRSSFRYRRVDEARYDRRAMIAESRLRPHVRVHVCETLPEFERARAATPDAGGGE
jgi:hypothetical protein